MPARSRPPARDPKVEALRADQVSAPVFATHEFFDPRDLVQVKYEMIRRVEVEAQPVAATAAAFHFSRPSFYQAQRALQQRGVPGLLPRKRGPRGGHKLTAEIVAFLQELRDTDSALPAPELARRVAQRFATTVHPRSIERALARQERNDAGNVGALGRRAAGGVPSPTTRRCGAACSRASWPSQPGARPLDAPRHGGVGPRLVGLYAGIGAA